MHILFFFKSHKYLQALYVTLLTIFAFITRKRKSVFKGVIGETINHVLQKRVRDRAFIARLRLPLLRLVNHLIFIKIRFEEEKKNN